MPELIALLIIGIFVNLGAIIGACSIMNWSPFLTPLFRASISPTAHRHIHCFQISGYDDEDALEYRRLISRGAFAWL